MSYFRGDNTEGFSAHDLNTLNYVFDFLPRSGFEEYTIGDAINNEWRPGITKAALMAAVCKRLKR